MLTHETLMAENRIWTRVGRQGGFTLIELVAVMAILAILVAVVAPAAVNTERAGIRAQVQADSQQVRNAANDFFAKHNQSEVRTPHTVTLTTAINDETNEGILASGGASGQQVVSSRWPELFITRETSVPTGFSSRYSDVFPTATVRVPTGRGVVNVTLVGVNGENIPGSQLLTQYTAVDLDRLLELGLLKQMPDAVERVSATGVDGLGVPNFLWLFKKADSNVGSDDDRAVVVFSLSKVQQIELAGGADFVQLTYEQILGPQP